LEEAMQNAAALLENAAARCASLLDVGALLAGEER
jgi:hypothetical protein